MPEYLYANATYLVPVTVAFVGSKLEIKQEVLRDGKGKQTLFFIVDKKNKRAVSLKEIAISCKNGTNVIWNHNDCKYIELKPGTSDVTFWLLPPSKVQSHFNAISNKNAEWTINVVISDSKRPIEIKGKSLNYDGTTQFLLSPQIPVVEIGNKEIKWSNGEGKNELIYYSQGEKKFVYLASKDNQYVKIGANANFSNLTLGGKYEWDRLKMEGLFRELGIKQSNIMGEAGPLNLLSTTILFGGETRYTEETIGLVHCKPTASITYGISYPSKPLIGELKGMNLNKPYGRFEYPPKFVEIMAQQDNTYNPAWASAVGTFASSTAGVLIAAVAGAPIATVGIASPLLAKLIPIGNIVKDIMNETLKSYATEYFKPETNDGIYYDAYSDISASVIVLHIKPNGDPAACLMDGKYEKNNQVIEIKGGPFVNVGETLWIEASCSSKVYLTTHFWDWANASSHFNLQKPEEVLRSFEIF